MRQEKKEQSCSSRLPPPPPPECNQPEQLVQLVTWRDIRSEEESAAHKQRNGRMVRAEPQWACCSFCRGIHWKCWTHETARGIPVMPLDCRSKLLGTDEEEQE